MVKRARVGRRFEKRKVKIVVGRGKLDQELRFRVSKLDLLRLGWLIKHHPYEYHSVSALLRSLISSEVDRVQQEPGMPAFMKEG